MALSIEITDLSFTYPGTERPALDHVTFAIPTGSVCALVGPTGAGKSTLLHGISGILLKHFPGAEATGSIKIGEAEHHPLPEEVLAPDVGMVTQEPLTFISGMRDSVSDELRFTLENFGIVKSEQDARIATALGQLNITHLAQRKPYELSGGELQRTAIASVIVATPHILLLDEPTNSLDGDARRLLGRLLRSLTASTTVVVADCDTEMALTIADTIVVLNEGHVLFCGSRNRFLARLADFVDILPVTPWIEVARSMETQRANKYVQRLLRIIAGHD